MKSMVRRALCAALVLLAGAAAQGLPAAPRLTYTRSFPQSDPSYISVTIAQDGEASFTAREHDRDPLVTLPFQARPATVSKLFSAADALGDFSGPRLQSKDDVAFTGNKSLAWDSGGRHTEQQFTYTTLPPAVRLVGALEAIAASGMAAVRLERAMRYDKLDVLDEMRQIQDAWNSHALGEPQLLAPTLERLAGDDSQMDAARQRAQKLLAAIRKSTRSR